jgi:LysM repeat protein
MRLLRCGSLRRDLPVRRTGGVAMTHPRRHLSLFPLFFIAFLATLFILGISFLPAEDVQVLGVSASRPDSPALAQRQAATGCVYWVRPGDNLFRIGLRYGVSYQYLVILNGIPNPNLIFAGTSLSVPCAGAPSTGIPLSNCPASVTYLVKPGDNLFRIALNHGSTIEWIRAANNLYGRVLRSGTTLTIPCPGTVTYRQVPPPGSTPAPGVTPTAPASNFTIISIDNNQFSQTTLTVSVGQAITVNNNDTIPHVILCPNCPASLGFNPVTITAGAGSQFSLSESGIYTLVLQEQQSSQIAVTVNP